ncbi:MAG TPA: LacI family DNA-binding transcriptional regulator [Solirubrobacteraceae bacterium]|jgi:LacI family transcriptional regulator|nr:LacI family DNA-binding transcriptional regulator [Solirubrobacteraceae bacterium]
MSTLADVARLAQVSPATVSRFLSGRKIRAAEAVQQAIDTLGYSPNAIAQSLKSGRTGNIGVIVPDISNPYFASVVKGIDVVSRERAYNLLLCNTDDSARRQDQALEALIGVVDALILTPAIDSDVVPAALARDTGPLVLLDREFAERLPCDTVLVDNVGGARQAATYLAQIGHRDLGIISGPLTSTPGRLRHDGFLQGLRESGITVAEEKIYIGDFREMGGYVGMKHLLAEEPPTAVFVANNLMAMGALRACKESGVRIPHDLSFISFDDLELANLLEPAITTVSRQSTHEGALAMSLLAQRLEGQSSQPPRRCVLETRLSLRDSCAAPSRGLASGSWVARSGSTAS